MKYNRLYGGGEYIDNISDHLVSHGLHSSVKNGIHNVSKLIHNRLRGL